MKKTFLLALALSLSVGVLTAHANDPDVSKWFTCGDAEREIILISPEVEMGIEEFELANISDVSRNGDFYYVVDEDCPINIEMCQINRVSRKSGQVEAFCRLNENHVSGGFIRTINFDKTGTRLYVWAWVVHDGRVSNQSLVEIKVE